MARARVGVVPDGGEAAFEQTGRTGQVELLAAAGTYGAGALPIVTSAGYQSQTDSSRGWPAGAAKGSVRLASVQSKVTLPTAYRPVGAGRTTGCPRRTATKVR